MITIDFVRIAAPIALVVLPPIYIFGPPLFRWWDERRQEKEYQKMKDDYEKKYGEPWRPAWEDDAKT